MLPPFRLLIFVYRTVYSCPIWRRRWRTIQRPMRRLRMSTAADFRTSRTRSLQCGSLCGSWESEQAGRWERERESERGRRGRASQQRREREKTRQSARRERERERVRESERPRVNERRESDDRQGPGAWGTDDTVNINIAFWLVDAHRQPLQPLSWVGYSHLLKSSLARSGARPLVPF